MSNHWDSENKKKIKKLINHSPYAFAKIAPSSPNPFSHAGRRGARLVFWFPSPLMGEGLGVRVLGDSA